MSKGTLLLLSLGPVQSFIASARKTEDLWSGSYILSYMTEKAIALTQEQAEKQQLTVELIFPAAAEINLDLMVAAFPNRLLCLVHGDPDVTARLAGAVESKLYDCFEKICSFGVEEVFSQSNIDLDALKAVVKDQAQGFFEVFWAVEPIREDGYESARRKLEARLAAVKNNRKFDPHEQDGIVCTVCGERDALHDRPYSPTARIGAMRYQLRSTWAKRSRKYRSTGQTQSERDDGGRIRDSEFLCGICLGKRTAREFFGEVRNRYYEPFRSTVDISHPRTYYSILVMDGDDMGQWLSGDKGQFSDPPGTVEYHQMISKRLAYFSGGVVPQLVTDAGGSLVYAGGDDVLALTPVINSFRLAGSLRAAFSDPKVGLHEEATASMGMVIAYMRAPLGQALEQARQMEKKAKSYVHPHTKKPKDALGVSLVTNSGEIREFVLPWMLNGGPYQEDSIYNLVELMEECVNLLEHELSPTFMFQLAQAFLPLVNQHGKLPQEHDKLLQLELRRLLQRSLLKPTKEKKDLVDRLCPRLMNVHNVIGSTLEFIHWLESLKFFRKMKRGGRDQDETSA
ncbi:MAG: type III-B CRISPR-associated protein Cas10/Cmr2 [Limnochordia bacterium]|jgi:CRISPR-associated protein Cmr2